MWNSITATRAIACLGVLMLVAACGRPFDPGYVETEPVYLRNPGTGQIVRCGPYHPGNAGANAIREVQCIKDYKEQGYIRIPEP